MNRDTTLPYFENRIRGSGSEQNGLDPQQCLEVFYAGSKAMVKLDF